MDIVKILADANRNFKTADHMLYVTYPLVKDNKLLILVAENLCKALLAGLDALLYYETLYKRIRGVPENFVDKMDILKRSIASRYNIPRSNIVVIEDLNAIIEQRKKSPMEFVKREKYVICSSDYKTSVLTTEKLKNYINESRLFLNKVTSLIENARRFSSL